MQRRKLGPKKLVAILEDVRVWLLPYELLQIRQKRRYWAVEAERAVRVLIQVGDQPESLERRDERCVGQEAIPL